MPLKITKGRSGRRPSRRARTRRRQHRDQADDREDEQLHGRKSTPTARPALVHRGPRRRDELGAPPRRPRPAPSASATARTSRVPTITPSAIRPDRRRLLRGADPEPDRGRDRRVGPDAATSSARPLRQLVALAGDPGVGDHVDEALGGARRSGARRSAGVVGATSGTSASPTPRSASADLPALLRRQVGDDHPGRAGVGEQRARTRPARGPGPCSRRPSAPPGPARRSARRSASTASSVAPAVERRGRRRVDHGAVGERVGERDAELDQVGAGLGVGLGHRGGGLSVGEAAHHVRHQRRPALPPARRRRPRAIAISHRRAARPPRRGPCRRGPRA